MNHVKQVNQIHKWARMHGIDSRIETYDGYFAGPRAIVNEVFLKRVRPNGENYECSYKFVDKVWKDKGRVQAELFRMAQMLCTVSLELK